MPKHISRERKHFHIFQDKVYCGKCHPRRIEYRVRESICESLLERKKKLEVEQQNNQISKMQCYERHKRGIIEKDEYFAKRETLTQRTRDIEQEILLIEDNIQENTVSRNHLNVDKLR